MHTRLLACFLAMTFLVVSARAADAPASRPARTPNPELADVKDDPALPRVLIIGDSISIGYTLPVRQRLKGVAKVHRPPANCGPTSRGIANLDKWLGDSKWDLIHFNFGLHDLRYDDANKKPALPPAGKQLATVDVYEDRLRTIVARLKKTGAKLIWANTTPVPADSPGRIAGDEVKYNDAAARVMKENDIPTDDLHTVVEQHPGLQLPNNVHFTKEGYDTLADAVAASIKSALGK